MLEPLPNIDKALSSISTEREAHKQNTELGTAAYKAVALDIQADAGG